MTDPAAPEREMTASQRARRVLEQWQNDIKFKPKTVDQAVERCGRDIAIAIAEAEQAAAARGRKEGMEEAAQIAKAQAAHAEICAAGGLAGAKIGQETAEVIEAAIRERAGQEEG